MQTAWITILLEHLVFLEANSKLQNWSNKSARKCLVIQGLTLTQKLKVHPPPPLLYTSQCCPVDIFMDSASTSSIGSCIFLQS